VKKNHKVRYKGDAWIINFGLPNCTCPNWDWFTTYQSMNCVVVLMRNNMSCKVNEVLLKLEVVSS